MAGETTPGNVKLLLPPRQSRGALSASRHRNAAGQERIGFTKARRGAGGPRPRRTLRVRPTEASKAALASPACSAFGGSVTASAIQAWRHGPWPAAAAAGAMPPPLRGRTADWAPVRPARRSPVTRQTRRESSVGDGRSPVAIRRRSGRPSRCGRWQRCGAERAAVDIEIAEAKVPRGGRWASRQAASKKAMRAISPLRTAPRWCWRVAPDVSET
jgi:hypothetical protein